MPNNSTTTSYATAVLFDIDGTLVDSNYLHVDAWGRAFAEIDAEVDAWRIHRCIGMDGDLLLDTLLPDAADEVRERASRLHSDLYADMHPRMRRLHGAKELLDCLADRGVRVVLATSAPEKELAMLRKILEVEDIVSAVTSGEDVDTAKPKPDIVEIALERSGVDASEAVFVGDAVWDAEACVKAGLTFIGLRSGGISPAELREAGATSVFDDPADLATHLDDSEISHRGQPPIAASN